MSIAHFNCYNIHTILLKCYNFILWFFINHFFPFFHIITSLNLLFIIFNFLLFISYLLLFHFKYHNLIIMILIMIQYVNFYHKYYLYNIILYILIYYSMFIIQRSLFLFCSFYINTKNTDSCSAILHSFSAYFYYKSN